MKKETSVQRIQRMENIMDDVTKAFYSSDAFEYDEQMKENIRILSDYMSSGLWLSDYEKYERSELPRNLKCGVLAQDTLYDLLSDIRKKAAYTVDQNNYRIIKISDHPEMKAPAAVWFHEKWGIPSSVYLESMANSAKDIAVPQWYIMMADDDIICGMGIIENDFHPRVDLSPNVCAVYTKESFRNQGLAGALLDFVCKDMRSYGIDTLYLVTDHTGFYEKYGWEFLCYVKCNGQSLESRIYIHKEK